MSIVGESRALPRKAAKARILAFVETLSDREPQREQPRKRTMGEGERSKSLARYHARMAAMTSGQKEEYRRHKNEVRRKRLAAKKGVHLQAAK